MGTPIAETRCGVCHEIGHDRRRHARTEVTCRVCGKIEAVPPNRVDSYRTCSSACHYAWRRTRGPTEAELAHLSRLHAGIRDGTVDTMPRAHRTEMRRLRDEVARLRCENEELRRRVDDLGPPWQSSGFDPSTLGEP